jgi:type I restriction enzyme S subunit
MDKIMIPIIDKIIVNNTQIKTLESLRDTLLPKLISGDIRVEYEEVS